MSCPECRSIFTNRLHLAKRSSMRPPSASPLGQGILHHAAHRKTRRFARTHDGEHCQRRNLPHLRQEFVEIAKPPGWVSLKTMEDEINHILSRAESKFCASNGHVCTSRTVGLLVRRQIVAGEFHFIGKEACTRWAGGPDPSMLADAGALDPADETCREYERVVDVEYLDQIRTEAKEFSNNRLSRQSGV